MSHEKETFADDRHYCADCLEFRRGWCRIDGKSHDATTLWRCPHKAWKGDHKPRTETGAAPHACIACNHYGSAGTGGCAVRKDLPKKYGQYHPLYILPPDHGKSCEQFSLSPRYAV